MPRISRSLIPLMASGLLATFAFAQGSADHQTSSPNAATRSASSITDPLRSLFFVQQFDEVDISPDGKKVAWVETQIDENGAQTGNHDIYISEYTKDPKPVRITAAAHGAHFNELGLAWSPDSKQLAFLSDAEKKAQLQLYAYSVDGGSIKKLTTSTGLLSTPAWSPDGKSIAVLYTENATRDAGPLVAETAETGVIKDAFFEQRLAVVDATGGSLRSITPDDTYIYEYDWASDSKSIVLTAAKGNGDSNWYIAELFAVDVASASMKSLYKPKLQIARPVVSPNGNSVAFIAGLMSDESSVGGDVFVIPRNGGAPRNLTPDRKASASLLAWTADGKLIDMENVDGESSVARIDMTNGHIESLYRAPQLLTSGFWSTSLSLTRDGATAAFVRTSFNDPPEIFAGPFGKWKQVTQRNAALKPAWGEAKSLHWKSDGYDVQGWLIYPKDFDPAKKYPMVVAVHGGGSFGTGEAFTRANVKDFGYGDWRDILAGVDEVLRTASVDPNRLGLTGWSYGGYMTMWGVTQTDRFKAAVAGAGITNWSSYYGENRIDQWMIPFFGKSVYDDPEVYARSAPLTFIKNVKTPTLIIVGDSDGECPTPQSYEFWHALKTLGVKTELVVYEREGHMFVNPEHQRDVVVRATAWFDDYLK
ncbi:MAG: S9 family peptidase [Candidatus Acidiferrum sp.]